MVTCDFRFHIILFQLCTRLLERNRLLAIDRNNYVAGRIYILHDACSENAPLFHSIFAYKLFYRITLIISAIIRYKYAHDNNLSLKL